MQMAIAIVPLGAAAAIIKYIMPSILNPNAKQEEEAKKARRALQTRLAAAGRPMIVTNKYEDMVMSDLTFPAQITVTVNDIGGMQKVKDSLFETVIVPLINPQLFSSTAVDPSQKALVAAPTGVLFYGPPGTGKTMMAQAIARDCNATFINMQLSTLQNKWFGESLKLVRALFSLAHKLAPTIIFIDEVDMFLRERQGGRDHEVGNAHTL
jgi:ATP-dependent 26S proteasome regulatory subunit